MARHVRTDRAGTAQSLSTTGTIVAAIACGGLATRTQTLVKRQQIWRPQTPNNRRAHEPESRGDDATNHRAACASDLDGKTRTVGAGRYCLVLAGGVAGGVGRTSLHGSDFFTSGRPFTVDW